MEESIAILEREDDPSELAWGYSYRSQLAMLEGDNGQAITDARRALALIGPDGDPELRGHALNNIGTARLGSGDLGGVDEIRASLEIGLEHDYDEHIVRAFCNLVALAVQQHRQGDAETWIAEAAAFYRDRDVDAWSLYIDGWRALLLLERGAIEEARQLAVETAEHPRCPPVSQIIPRVAVALVAARRGTADVRDDLATALGLARGSGGVMRVSPVVCAIAEAAWLTGGDPHVDLLEELLPRALRFGDRYAATALATWLGRLGAAPDVAPDDLAGPGAAALAGRHAEAAAQWEAIGAPYEQALALIDAGDVAGLRAAVATLDAMGATATAAVARARLRDLGAAVPSGPRRATRENPVGLSAREVEVLELLAQGATDAEIAARLVISIRTAGHHVSAILRKLEVPSRARAAALADDLLEGRQPAAGR
jgi:DNA-binding CsgD family transcriptional regulator/tetratricopeptide (TPR) repeat protein